MHISQCQLGDIVSLFLDPATLRLSRQNTGVLIQARIIGHFKLDDDRMLGWKLGVKMPGNTFLLGRRGGYHSNVILHDSFDQYQCGNWVKQDFPIWSREVDKGAQMVASSGQAVNDHTCSACRRGVNKLETRCWWCGSNL